MPECAARPATIAVQAEHEVGLGLTSVDASVYGVIAVGRPSVVQVRAFGQLVTSFDQIETAQIDAIEAGFALMGGKVDGGKVLESGGVYGAQDWEDAGYVERSIVPVVVRQYAGEHTVCTVPRSESFELRSANPEACAVMDERGHGLSVPPIDEGWQWPLELSADVLAAGRCELTLAAPDYAKGEGWERRLAVELNDIEMLEGRDRG